jgi:hypothetical protein
MTKVFFIPLLLLTVILCLSCRRHVRAAEELPAVQVQDLPQDQGSLLLDIYMRKTLNFPLKGNEFPYNLKGLKDIRIIAALTGEYSINKTTAITKYTGRISALYLIKAMNSFLPLAILFLSRIFQVFGEVMFWQSPPIVTLRMVSVLTG